MKLEIKKLATVYVNQDILIQKGMKPSVLNVVLNVENVKIVLKIVLSVLMNLELKLLLVIVEMDFLINQLLGNA